MKKTGKMGALILALALSATLAVPALAAEEENAGEPAVQEDALGITVDGKTVDAEACIMVPLRAVSEALGFTVTWDGTLPGARVDSGKMHIDVTLGVDRYVGISNHAVGMTAPFSLGVPPVMNQGSIYVPVGLFRVLLGNRSDAVTVEGDTVTIHTDSGVEIPNPWQECASQAELEKAAGFSVPQPVVPAGYALKARRVLSGQMAELVYAKGEETLTYRVSPGSEDNSGDYTVYQTESTLPAGGAAVTCRGEGATVSLALWTWDGYSFSLAASAGLSSGQVKTAVESTL